MVIYYEGIKYKEMIVMKQELVSDKAVENYVKKEVARELKKELLRRSRSITEIGRAHV